MFAARQMCVPWQATSTEKAELRSLPGSHNKVRKTTGFVTHCSGNENAFYSEMCYKTAQVIALIRDHVASRSPLHTRGEVFIAGFPWLYPKSLVTLSA